MASGELAVERQGAVALVRIQRPKALNALTPSLMEELADALEQLDASGEVNAIVIAGDERAFCAGADVQTKREQSLSEALADPGARFWPRLAAIGVPMIAAVSGYAFGGGCELALACDLIVASRSAQFSQAEIRLGIIPGGGGTQRLARTIGKQRTMEIVLTGDRVSAEDAHALGFVNRVVPEDRWLDEAMDLARQIASRPPLALRFAKRAVLAAEETTLTAGMSAERRLYELSMATDDRVEGMAAFIERRDPEWRGT